MNANQNFKEISKQLLSAAPTEKAFLFAEKLISQIEAKGEEWIESHAAELQVTFVPSEANFPVRDNRLFYIGKFQTALTK